MSILSDNMRYLRNQKALSQQKIADELVITRGRYAKYEDAASEPPIEILLRISKLFHVSIDLLVSVDLRKYPLEQMLSLPDNRILLPVVVDEHGRNRIEIVPQKASMGYLSGYSDPEYIESLQTIALPFLTHGKYRAFPASGDSMPPFKDGTYIVGRYVESPAELRRKRTYVFVTRSEGIIYKRYQAQQGAELHISSDNNFYAPYNLHLGDLLEIWEYACSISTQEFEPDDFDNQSVKGMFQELRRDIRELDEKLDRAAEAGKG